MLFYCSAPSLPPPPKATLQHWERWPWCGGWSTSDYKSHFSIAVLEMVSWALLFPWNPFFGSRSLPHGQQRWISLQAVVCGSLSCCTWLSKSVVQFGSAMENREAYGVLGMLLHSPGCCSIQQDHRTRHFPDQGLLWLALVQVVLLKASMDSLLS